MNNNINDIVLNEEDTMQGRFLSLALDDEIFALEIKYVTEIVGIQPITSVPEIPDYVKGIINLRGKIIPVIDMRLKFKKSQKEYNDRTCIIVVDIDEISVGFIVDSVEEVISISDESIVPPPDYKVGIQNRYIKGVGMVEDKVILLLDCMKLLSNEEVEDLLDLDKK
ncbi:MAG: CheW protein [Oscillospiraceae bacterium]|jgi:purine-binding chemotaxis protein CheW|nr:CheW protein [Oscillospiraceae bacterium]